MRKGLLATSLEVSKSLVCPAESGTEDLHSKKRLAVFPSPDGMSLTKLLLVGKNLIIPAQVEFGK
jgi:hypothetical protein